MRSRGTGAHELDEPGEVLAVHTDARVRGAIHRSFAEMPQYDFVLAQSVDEARQRLARKRPVAILANLDEASLQWSAELYSRFVAPVVLCFAFGEIELCRAARAQGLHHFVELPRDHPSAWARNAERIRSTLESAIHDHRGRVKGFAKSTLVMPAAPQDLAASKVDAATSSGRQRRTTLVQEVTESELAQARGSLSSAAGTPVKNDASETGASKTAASKTAGPRKAKRKKRRRKAQQDSS